MIWQEISSSRIWLPKIKVHIVFRRNGPQYVWHVHKLAFPKTKSDTEVGKYFSPWKTQKIGILKQKSIIRPKSNHRLTLSLNYSTTHWVMLLRLDLYDPDWRKCQLKLAYLKVALVHILNKVCWQLHDNPRVCCAFFNFSQIIYLSIFLLPTVLAVLFPFWWNDVGFLKQWRRHSSS